MDAKRLRPPEPETGRRKGCLLRGICAPAPINAVSGLQGTFARRECGGGADVAGTHGFRCAYTVLPCCTQAVSRKHPHGAIHPHHKRKHKGYDMEKHICIAIDGPAGAGKSTIAKGIAARLGVRYLDTGAMYRAVALFAKRNGVDAGDGAALEKLLPSADVRVIFSDDGQRVLLGEEDVTGLLRTPDISMAASGVGIHPCVRIKLTELQRQVARVYSVVMEGRDITTNVLPDTPYKFYITASPEERARRRLRELIQKGGGKERYETVLADIKQRDYDDSTRAFMPLRVADDAILVDTTNMSIDEALDQMIAYIEEKGSKA